MTLSSRMQIGLVTVAAALLAWQSLDGVRQNREMASLHAQIRAQDQELDSRLSALKAARLRNEELRQFERRAGNQTLLTLMRERAAFTRSASKAGSQTRGIGGALANVLDNPEQWDAEREQLRDKMRAGLGTFFRLLNLPREKADAFIDVGIEEERRKAARLSALLHGTVAVAEALRERDNDQVEFDKQRHEAIGDDGINFFNGIADGMRNDEAKRLLKIVQQNMGGNDLSPDQSDRLQALIKTEIVPINMDDIELFRPPDEWSAGCIQHQENLLQAAAEFLTPAQIDSLRTIGAYNLAERQRQMAARRAALGIQ